MFRDDQQLGRACRTLLATVRLERLWSADGPTAEASELLDADWGLLSSDERLAVLAAWALWNGSGGPTMIVRLDSEPATALCSLIRAANDGPDAIDGWLAAAASVELSPVSSARSVVKRCACGRAFDVYQWRSLRLVGPFQDDVDQSEDLELRTCPCGSTIAIKAAEMRAHPRGLKGRKGKR